MPSTNITETDTLIDRVSRTEIGNAPIGDERREKTRHPYQNQVVLILLSPTGSKSAPLIVHTKDVSIGGIRIVTRQMIHTGARGAIQLAKSDGSLVLVGVRVRHCRYVGNMEHHSGMQFIQLPHQLSEDDFPKKELPAATPNKDS